MAVLLRAFVFCCCLQVVKLNYSKDEVALSVCTAETSGPFFFYGRVLAVRRVCGSGITCQAICKKIDKSYTCFDAVHIYNRQLLSSYNAAHRYLEHGCEATYCGPNYCCCGK